MTLPRIKLLYLSALLISCLSYLGGIHPDLRLDSTWSLRDVDSNSDLFVLLTAVMTEASGPTGRPVSMASFALQGMLGFGAPEHFQIVNIVLHLLVSLLVVKFFSIVVSSANSKQSSSGVARLLPWMVGALWVLHPYNVSTVLYSVQRMAILSAGFSILTLIFYWEFRRRFVISAVYGFPLIAMILSFGMGVYAKENTASVLVFLAIWELFFLERESARSRLLRTAALVSCFLSILLLFIYWDDLASWISVGYERRPFSLGERLLTQIAVVSDYFSQIFAPEISRMGLYQDDFPVFTSWSSLLSAQVLFPWMLMLLGLFSGLLTSRLRYVSFGVVFFLSAHLVESTFVPLELYFEHRNYLSSLGLLFSGVAALFGVTELIRVGWAKIARGFALALFVIALGIKLINLTAIWKDPVAFRLHSYQGHPSSPRAVGDFSEILAKSGRVEESLAYSAVMHDLKPSEQDLTWYLRDVALLCFAGVNPEVMTPRLEALLPTIEFLPSELRAVQLARSVFLEYPCSPSFSASLAKLLASEYRKQAEGQEQFALDYSVGITLAYWLNDNSQLNELKKQLDLLALLGDSPVLWLMYLDLSIKLEDRDSQESSMRKLVDLRDRKSLTVYQAKLLSEYIIALDFRGDSVE